jgi:hypothetical protein
MNHIFKLNIKLRITKFLVLNFFSLSLPVLILKRALLIANGVQAKKKI